MTVHYIVKGNRQVWQRHTQTHLGAQHIELILIAPVESLISCHDYTTTFFILYFIFCAACGQEL